MTSVKYIAAGFQTDSESLLNEFVLENSTNFTLFTTKWKEHNFSWIFAGRDDEELYQFTNEIFQITLGYLENGSVFLQIGAVYLLYALYRNQPSSPPVQIRITLPQYEKLKKLQNLAEKNCYMHLHYIINFLSDNFEFVANSEMLGPCCSKGKIEADKTPFQSSLLSKDCKADLRSFRDSNSLKEIKAMNKEYTQLTQKLFPNAAVEEEEIDEYITALDSLLNEGTLKKSVTNKEVCDAELGDRRAQIKANQFSKKAFFRQLNPSDSDDDYEPGEDGEKKGGSLQKQPKKKRVAKDKRKVGRPKKTDLDINELLESDEIDPGTKVRTKQRRGPVRRGNYADKYELKIPDFNKTFLKEFLGDCTSPETSEEEPAACNNENEEGSVVCKKENEDTQDVAPGKAEGAYYNGYPEDDSSEEESARFTEASAKYNVPNITSFKKDEEPSSEDADDPDSNTKEIYTLL